jgi:hypothetical protein
MATASTQHALLTSCVSLRLARRPSVEDSKELIAGINRYKSQVITSSGKSFSMYVAAEDAVFMNAMKILMVV